MTTYHFIGIGGIGMSALAKILLEKGEEVQGSDLSSTYVTDSLKQAGALVYDHHSETHIQPAMKVVYNSMILSDHPEIKEAKARSLPIIHRSQLLSELMQGQKGLLVAGVHGKTTTTSLLAHVLKFSGLDPSFAVGGTLLNWETNGGYGKGEYFVIEADESDGSFLNYPAFGAIITNIEKEHLDYWKSEEALVAGFKTFAAQVASQDLIFWCADDSHLQKLSLGGRSYGFHPEATARIMAWKQQGWEVCFDLQIGSKSHRAIALPLLGRHNVLNGAAVFAMALALGIAEEKIREAFASFKGIKRRVEKKGEKRGVCFYDDYGHHPTEIQTTLQAVRKATGEKRLITIFQPHRYTRTRDCFEDFLTCFEETDIVILTDIYPAFEQPIAGITGQALFDALCLRTKTQCYFAPRHELAAFSASLLRPHDVVITLGAGDITRLSDEILKHKIAPYKMALITGGKSTEHDVALMSASVLREQIDPELYQVTSMTITKQGSWQIAGEDVAMASAVAELQKCDLAFPILHGPFGEDGLIQGFFEIVGIPYVGCDARASVVCMDKAWTKRIVMSHGVAVADFLEYAHDQWREDPMRCEQEILAKFHFPFFVKAVHLGSTIGVYRVCDEIALKKALSAVCELDYRFIVEEAIEGKEIQFGVLGNSKPYVASPAEIIRLDVLHTYEEKYGKNATPSVPKTPLPEHVAKEGLKLAKVVYRACGCSGVSRLDFFLTEDERWILNEVNPMPGCTPTSAFPKIMLAEGISLKEMVNRIVISGLNRHRFQERIFKL